MTEQAKKKVGAVMVVGGGIAGMQSALDLANSGFKVYLVERTSSIGGRMAQLDKTFPTNDCSMCMISPKLIEVAKHRNIEIITNAELDELVRLGAVGDICLRYFDIDGKPIASDVDERVMGISLDDLKQVERVVGVTGGPNKYRAIHAALAGKLVNVIITDHVSAQNVLNV